MLATLILLDGLIVGLHVARQFAIRGIFGETVLADPRLDLADRLGLGRFLELSTLAVAIVLSFFAFARSREPIYLCGAAALAVVLAVTGFRIHGPVGKMIGTLLPFGPLYPLSAPYVGEAIGLAATGAILVALLVWGITRSSVGHAQLGVAMTATLVLLGLFSGGVDLVHALVYSFSDYLVLILQVIEEGGELFVFSIALMLMAAAVRCPRRIVGLT